MKIFKSLTAVAMIGLATLSAAPVRAELSIIVDKGIIEPMPIAVPDFIDEGGAGDLARDISRVVAADLAGTGLFTETPQSAYISQVTSFDALSLIHI